jgi:hypothetical protein
MTPNAVSNHLFEKAALPAVIPFRRRVCKDGHTVKSNRLPMLMPATYSIIASVSS